MNYLNLMIGDPAGKSTIYDGFDDMTRKTRKVVLTNTGLTSRWLAKYWESQGYSVLYRNPDKPKSKPIPFNEALEIEKK